MLGSACLLLLQLAATVAAHGSYHTSYAERLCEPDRKSEAEVYVGYVSNNTAAGIVATKDHHHHRMPDMNCHITLRAPAGSRIMVQVHSCDFDPFSGDYVKINGVKYSHHCGYGNKITSDSNSLHMSYHSGSERVSKTYDGFLIYYTVFLDESGGECTHHDFQFSCHNDRCIWQRLRCDDVNNCENDQDEKHCGLSLGVKIGAALGTLGILLVLGSIIYILFCRPRDKTVSITTIPSPCAPPQYSATSY